MLIFQDVSFILPHPCISKSNEFVHHCGFLYVASAFSPFFLGLIRWIDIVKSSTLKFPFVGSSKIIWIQTQTLWFHQFRRNGVVVRAFALQSVDLGFISLVESYQKTLKIGMCSFPAWRSAFMGGCGEQAGKFARCVLRQGT